ncbi:hypothetical protein ACFSQ7_09940 [Paenibacillus rhizoplanae]
MMFSHVVFDSILMGGYADLHEGYGEYRSRYRHDCSTFHRRLPGLPLQPTTGGRSWKSRFVFNKHMQRLRLLIRDSAAAAV